MKLKNISLAEKHVDKLVILLSAAFLLYVVWAYVISNRFNVELNGQPIPPAQIDDMILGRANMLDRNLKGPAPDVLNNWQSPDYVGLFTAALVAPATPPGPDGDTNRLLTSMITGPGVPIVIGEHVTESQIPDANNPPYAMPNLPVPASVVAHSDMGTLDTTNNPIQILKTFGNQPPFDVEWVSVAARVDIASLAAQLQGPLPPNTQRLKPEDQQKLTILDVQLQRRMLQPDGSWSEPEIVSEMVGRYSIRSTFPAITGPSLAQSTIDAARANLPQILQPSFYALRNAVWTPPQLPEPGAAEVTPGETTPPATGNALADLQNQLKIANQQLAQLQQRLMTQPAAAAQLQRRIEMLQARIMTLTQKIQALTSPGSAPGGFPGGFPGADPGMDFGPGGPGMMPGDMGPADVNLTGSLLSLDKVVCWANDFTVKSGKVYQYRMRLIFSNPLYRMPSIPANQKELSDQFTLAGDWSDWTDSVHAIQNSYYFVLAGNSAQQTARIEIWKFHDGLWRKYEDNFAPGDPVGKPTDQYTDMVAAATNPDGSPAFSPTGVPAPHPIIDFAAGAVLVDTDFSYKVLLPALNISQTTLRAIFVTDGKLTSRTAMNDKDRRETLIQQVIPNVSASASPDNLELMRAYKERQDRLRGTGTTPGGTGMPPDMMPDDMVPLPPRR